MDANSKIIKDRLLYMFPDKIVEGLSSRDINFYQSIAKYLREKNSDLTMEQYIESLGFAYRRKGHGFDAGTDFDFESVMFLLEHYDDINQTVLANFIGISRQRVSQRVNAEEQHGRSWKSEKVSESEIKLIKTMVTEEHFFFDYDEECLAILTGSEKGPVFLHRNLDGLKIDFNLDYDLIQFLKENDRYYYGYQSYLHTKFFESVMVGGIKKYRIKEQSNIGKVKNYCRARGIDFESYLKILNVFPYVDGREMTDQEWIDRLTPFVQKDGCLRLEFNSTNYNGLSRRSRQLGFSNGQEYAELLGFNWPSRDYEREYKERIAEYIEQLKLNSIDGYYVYIPTDSNLYRNLYSMLRRRGIEFDHFLESIGLERLNRFEYQQNYGIQNMILDKLMELQSSSGKITTNDEKIVRNKKLVALLKKLYEYRCQLCGNEPILPPIEKDDGTFYCEIHHITPISSALTISDIETLDHYSNALCLCPYHHAYVHHHKGGFPNLLFEAKSFYLVSQQTGERVKVKFNLHLQVNSS